MNKKWAMLLLLCFFVVACAPAMRVNHFPEARVFPPVAPENVELLRRDPQQPFDAFAESRYSPPKGMSLPDAERKLKEKGASIGADALLVSVDHVYSKNVWVGPEHGFQGRIVENREMVDRVMVAVAIRYQR